MLSLPSPTAALKLSLETFGSGSDVMAQHLHHHPSKQQCLSLKAGSLCLLTQTQTDPIVTFQPHRHSTVISTASSPGSYPIGSQPRSQRLKYPGVRRCSSHLARPTLTELDSFTGFASHQCCPPMFPWLRENSILRILTMSSLRPTSSKSSCLLPYPKRQKWDGLGSLADYPPKMKNLGDLSAACSPSTERTSCCR